MTACDAHGAPAALTRRAAIARAGAVLATAALGACATPRGGRTAPALPVPLVAPERVIRTVAGLRPYRATGFVVRAERLGEKLLIHNYGHGGCGITLSYGTGRMALAHALTQPRRSVAVIGAGVVGLTAARLLQDHGFAVTIHAAALPPATTSNIAGGLWLPSAIVGRAGRTPAFAARLAQAARLAYRDFQLLVGAGYGVSWMPLYFAGSEPPTLGWDLGVTPELYPFTRLGPGEHPFAAPHAIVMPQMLIEPNIFLPRLLRDFRLAGGRVVVRRFTTPAQLLELPEPVIMNCTGLGSAGLFGDEELVPIKGELAVLLPQPELDYMAISTDAPLYMFPRADGVVLGGSFDRGEWSLEPRPAEIARILEGNRAFFAARGAQARSTLAA